MDRFLVTPMDEGWYNYIFNNYTKECIMTRKYNRRIDTINEVGKKYGMLTVVEQVDSPTSKSRRAKIRGAHWKCVCDCGNTSIVCGSNLRYGKAKSCGCIRERTIENTGINRLMSCYKTKARQRHLFFNLSHENFYLLIKGNCFYCDTEPKQILKRNKTDKIQIIYNGIDRLDSKKGYTPQNCVPCCRWCNQAKSVMSVDEFKLYIEKVYKCLNKICF